VSVEYSCISRFVGQTVTDLIYIYIYIYILTSLFIFTFFFLQLLVFVWISAHKPKCTISWLTHVVGTWKLMLPSWLSVDCFPWYVFRAHSLVSSTHPVESSLLPGVEGFRLTVSSYNSYSIPFKSSLLQNLLYRFVLSLSGSHFLVTVS
jgi:hypothetical protein